MSMEAQNPYKEVQNELAHLLIGLANFTQSKFDSNEKKHSEDFEAGFKTAMMIVITGITEVYLTELQRRSQNWEEVSKFRTEEN